MENVWDIRWRQEAGLVVTAEFWESEKKSSGLWMISVEYKARIDPRRAAAVIQNHTFHRGSSLSARLPNQPRINGKIEACP
jgi:hypothetical protein